MECELCYKPYDSFNSMRKEVIPKITTVCHHTFCQMCLERMKEQHQILQCPLCQLSITNNNQVPEQLPTNEQLVKALSYKEEEAKAMEKISKYEMMRPDLEERLGQVQETVKRKHQPYELQLKEINSFNEMIYIEEIGLNINSRGQNLDKRFLGPHQYTHKKYVFNVDSIFMNYFYMSETSQMLFLFRRLNTCQHKFSCAENIMRRFYKFITLYTTLIRLPIHLIMKRFGLQQRSNLILGIEVSTIVLFCLLYSGASCLVRYLHEEVIQPLPVNNKARPKHAL